MKAIVVSRTGSPEVLVVAERPTPIPRENEVVIDVRAAGVNRPDVLQRRGHYPAPAGAPSDILGLEVAGIVLAGGAAVTRWKKGDAVCALLGGGGYAEQVAVDAAHCLPVPRGWSFAEAAALPEATFTVWSNVFQRARLQAGENFLVHGGSSGIGLMAIQLARARGARVFATAGGDEKCRACTDAGAERVIDYHSEDFETVLKERGVDVVLDMIGGDYVAKNLSVLRPDGRLVFIGAMQNVEASINILHVMSRRLTLTGSLLRSRPPEFKAALAAEVEREVWPLAEAGRLRANVFKTFPLADAAEAHRLMESRQHIGKLVLVTGG